MPRDPLVTRCRDCGAEVILLRGVSRGWVMVEPNEVAESMYVDDAPFDPHDEALERHTHSPLNGPRTPADLARRWSDRFDARRKAGLA